jgi:Asp-tRNA(Asn)/Glu-tRNA(Gln) amidotransferase A subunit family amidase
MNRFRFLPLCAVAFLLVVACPFARALSVEEATIADLQAAYLSGELTTHQVIAAYLARIEAYDKQGPYLNSIININPKALEEADRLDDALRETGKPVGPLHGIPVIVKDCVDAVGMPMTAGFQGWKNYYPATDAVLVARIKAAGGIILAKSSLSEFTKGGADNINSVLGGFARNPYNTAYATGGSSGGTGASISANFGMLGIGSDTMGSIRNPSSFNALAGIRTTVGLVARVGMTPNSSLRDTVGPMTRTVTDLAKLLDVIAGPDPEDPASLKSEGHVPKTYTAFLKKDGLKGVRLGVLRQAFNVKGSDPKILEAFENTLTELKTAGAELIDPFTVSEFDSLPRPPQTAARFKDDMTKFLAKHPGIPYPSVEAIAKTKLVHPLHQPFWDEAADALPVDQDPATLKGMKDEQHWRDVFTQAVDSGQIDAIVMPNNAQPPVINGDRNTQKIPNPRPGGGGGGASSTTYIGSALQWPAIVVPAGFVNGLPISLQILGRQWDEPKLIQYAYAYEQATHHRLPPPTVPPLGP